MASLLVLKGPTPGERLQLDKAIMILGREAKDCDIVIPNQAVSRMHAQISQIQGQYFLEDLKSRNKTYLNNKLVETRQQLKDNDRIKICDSLYTFHSGQDSLPPLPAEIRRETPSDGEIELPSTVQATLSRLPQQQLLEAQPAERLRALLEISSYLSQTIEQDQLLDRIAETLMALFRQADRCFIIMKDEVTKQLSTRTFRNRRDNEESPRFSRTIVTKCLEQMEAFLVEDAATDKKFSMAESITDFRIRSVMIAPLAGPDATGFGVFQLDTQDRAKRFTQEDLRLLSSVANQASFALENARLHAATVRQAAVGRDLELAKLVQRSFLPSRGPAVAGYDFFMYYEAAMTIGGDYYDFIELPDGRQVILLGDVSGKGVPAALLMAKLSAEARFHMLTDADPAAAITKLNDFMIRTGFADKFVTLAAAVLDPARHRVGLINAGHMIPMIWRASAEQLDDAMKVNQGGLPLGVDLSEKYQVIEVALEPGDTLLVFTDGVTDALDPAGNQFQVEGVRAACVDDSVDMAGGLSPSRLGKKVIDAVRKHIANRDQYDDIALVSFGRYDAPPSGMITNTNTNTPSESQVGR